VKEAKGVGGGGRIRGKGKGAKGGGDREGGDERRNGRCLFLHPLFGEKGARKKKGVERDDRAPLCFKRLQFKGPVL